ncbi:hypothetical protein HMPREF0290_2281 [Corynebacterium efficiens YS-314]|nr:hypothetical protein HMPREF0290_2281 [Corynebacterium efficiens YS-314]
MSLVSGMLVDDPRSTHRRKQKSSPTFPVRRHGRREALLVGA